MTKKNAKNEKYNLLPCTVPLYTEKSGIDNNFFFLEEEHSHVRGENIVFVY